MRDSCVKYNPTWEDKENTNDSPANYKSLGVPWNTKTMISCN